jgi:hypothetical protein
VSVFLGNLADHLLSDLSPCFCLVSDSRTIFRSLPSRAWTRHPRRASPRPFPPGKLEPYPSIGHRILTRCQFDIPQTPGRQYHVAGLGQRWQYVSLPRDRGESARLQRVRFVLVPCMRVRLIRSYSFVKSESAKMDTFNDGTGEKLAAHMIGRWKNGKNGPVPRLGE